MLWDVRRLASCVPGCTDVIVAEEQRSYRATITQRVGPMSVSFPLSIVVQEAQPPFRIRVSAAGDDRRVASRIAAEVELTLSVTSSGGTEIRVVSDVSVHGRLASLGQAVIEGRAENVLDAFGRALAAELNGLAPGASELA